MTTPTAVKQRKLNERARKREDAAKRRKLAADAKAAAEEAKAELAAPAAQRTGTALRGARLDFDGRSVHRNNPIRTLAERSKHKDHALFRKAHADAADRLIAVWDLSQSISAGVSQYEQRAASSPQTGTISDANLRSVNAQISAKREIEALRTYFGESWNILYSVCIMGMTIASWAEQAKIKPEPASGYLLANLDRLLIFYAPKDEGRPRIRTIEFSTQSEDIS